MKTIHETEYVYDETKMNARSRETNGMAYHSSPLSMMETLLDGFPDLVPTLSIFLTTSIPDTTWPKTTCFPSSQSVFSVQMKN